MKCIQIVEELLSNCEQGPTIILKELKKCQALISIYISI